VLAHAVEGLLAAGLLRASVASLARELEARSTFRTYERVLR
jgi:hypothetical protein